MANRFGSKPSLDDFSSLISPQETTPAPTPEYTPTPKDTERKTMRLQLVLKPSTVERLGKFAKDYHTSRNDVVQQLLDGFLDGHEY